MTKHFYVKEESYKGKPMFYVRCKSGTALNAFGATDVVITSTIDFARAERTAARHNKWAVKA